MPTYLSTRSVSPRNRNAYWADWICATYVDLDCRPAQQLAPVSGELWVDRVGCLGVSRVHASGHSVIRTRERIARSSEDLVLLSYQVAGTGVVSQDGRCATLRAGDFAIYDSSRPYTLQFDSQFQQYVLTIPGDMVRSRLRRWQQLTARTISGKGPVSQVLGAMLPTLTQGRAPITGSSADMMAEGICQIMVAGVGDAPDAMPESALKALHLRRIRADIERHLRDPDFSLSALSQRLRLSPSTVRRAWADEPLPLRDYVMFRRLQGARRDLQDPAQRRMPISAVAYAWGFNDAAHFSRCFKARFGESPTESRERGSLAPDV